MWLLACACRQEAATYFNLGIGQECVMCDHCCCARLVFGTLLFAQRGTHFGL
jgi:hypothetical protein